jgi:hypothetical protein
MHAIIRSLAAFAALLSILAVTAGPVSAAKPNQLHFVDHPDGSDVFPYGECGEGLPLTVSTTGTVSGTITLDENGNFLSIELTARTTDTVTNTESGLSADIEYDARISNSPGTDLGDGTVAIYQKTAGTGKLRGPDGTSILWHSAGTTTVALVLLFPADGGPPSVVSETILFDAGLPESSDLCDALLPALGL